MNSSTQYFLQLVISSLSLRFEYQFAWSKLLYMTYGMPWQVSINGSFSHCLVFMLSILVKDLSSWRYSLTEVCFLSYRKKSVEFMVQIVRNGLWQWRCVAQILGITISNSQNTQICTSYLL